MISSCHLLTAPAFIKLNIVFCGCRVPGRWALEQAKTNLVNHYLLVGVTEQLGEFIALLETMLPQYFSGAYDLYTKGSLLSVPNVSPNSQAHNVKQENSSKSTMKFNW